MLFVPDTGRLSCRVERECPSVVRWSLETGFAQGGFDCPVSASIQSSPILRIFLFRFASSAGLPMSTN